MSLQIQTTHAQLGINTTRGQLNINQSKGDLNIRKTNPQVRINRELPTVIIDQYQCFAEAGLKNNRDLTREYAALGRQKVLQAISQINQEGDQLANIAKGMPSPIPMLAEQNAHTPQADFNIDLVPKSRPRIEVRGHLNIDWQMGQTNINYTPRKPVINYNPDRVETYLKQKPSIDIQYIEDRR